MSGIYIKGMEMPKRCLACQLNYDSCACILTGSRYYKHGVEFDPGEERLPDCPLIPVPYHGDLIERDDLISFCVRNKTDEWNKQVVTTYAKALDEFEDIVQDAPTIIPADKEGEG